MAHQSHLQSCAAERLSDWAATMLTRTAHDLRFVRQYAMSNIDHSCWAPEGYTQARQMALLSSVKKCHR